MSAKVEVELLRRLDVMTKERDEARDLLRAVAAACRGLGPRTDAVMSVVGNALAELDEALAKVERLRRRKVDALTTDETKE